MTTRPLIGLSCSHGKISDWDKTSSLPQYRMNMNYAEAVYAAGGVPVILPPSFMTTDPSSSNFDEMAEIFMEKLSGLILIGGGDFVEASSFKPTDFSKLLIKMDKNRDKWELALLRAATKSHKAVFGICRGLQMMNIFFGGTLYRDIDSEIPGALRHKQLTSRDNTSHLVTFEKNSRFVEILKSTEMEVNSGHHQAIKDVAPGFVVSGRSRDGIVEAMEHPDFPFCLGVQWHPEGRALISKSDLALFAALVSAGKS